MRADSFADGTFSAAQRQDAGKQFESMFVSLMLKEMRQSIEGDGLFDGESSDTLGGLFDLFMGDHIAQAGGVGIARLVETYLENAT